MVEVSAYAVLCIFTIYHVQVLCEFTIAFAEFSNYE